MRTVMAWIKFLIVIGLILGAVYTPYYLYNKRFPRMTLEQYGQLEIGMNVVDAITLLGQPGYLTTDNTTTLFTIQEYVYKEKYRKTFKTFIDPPKITLMFINGRLEQKNWES
ncbi:hypothetical protein PV433_17200 [Paenibacillus sp. GYB004]|uniref:hypothetical protein n=1 Tax=Paenibacillus sp. GYB004 TaxID=2994393 RepID=UPI002F964784